MEKELPKEVIDHLRGFVTIQHLASGRTQVEVRKVCKKYKKTKKDVYKQIGLWVLGAT